MCVIWLGGVKGSGKSHRKVQRSVDVKYVVQLRWLRVFDVLGNSFGVGLQARGFNVGVGGVADGGIRDGWRWRRYTRPLFPKCLWKFLSALMMDNNEEGCRAGPVTLFQVSGRFGLDGMEMDVSQITRSRCL
jgi:hypothetical protein